MTPHADHPGGPSDHGDHHPDGAHSDADPDAHVGQIPSNGQSALDAANSLNDAFVHGEPTVDLARAVAEGSTHYIGDVDRVVLGKWDGQDGGYIGEARHNGGIYFDTGDDVWKAVEGGLDSGPAKVLGWQVNEQFLQAQMERGVARIEYILPDGFDSVDQVARVRRESFSAMEINFLNAHASEFGYAREGNAWVYKGR